MTSMEEHGYVRSKRYPTYKIAAKMTTRQYVTWYFRYNNVFVEAGSPSASVTPSNATTKPTQRNAT